MVTTRNRWCVFALGAALAFVTASASAQVASSLINEGDPLGAPGDTVSSLTNPAANHIGGYAVGLTTVGSATLSRVWGTPDGVAAPDILLTEGTYGPLVQTSFESFYGMSDAGELCYSASGTGGPDGAFDSVWVDTTPIAVEGDPLPVGPYDYLFWSFASRPSITANGTPHFVGGTRTTVGGTTSARGLFDNTGTPILYTGEAIAGLPAPPDDSGSPVSFDYRVSAYGTNYIAEVEMETDGTGITTLDDNVMVMSGAALEAGGSIVRENSPVPAAIGGLPGELWDNFDFAGVTESGMYLLTGDTSAATTSDEIVVVNGMIVAREGELLDGHMINGAIEGGYMNENGDWAVIWDIDDPVEGNIEALFFNGQLLIKETDEVDFNGDGVVDPGVIISPSGLGFTGTSTLVVSDRIGGQVSIYFTADVSDNGAPLVEGFYRINVSVAPGDEGDLALVVADSPDPVTTVGDTITYDVVVTNNSPSDGTGVLVTSTLDPNVVFNAVASDPIAVHDGSPTGGVVTAALGTMTPSEIATYSFAVDTTQLGTVTTTHVVSGNETDPIPDNNTVVSETLVALITDLSLTLTDSPDPVVTPGGSITYTVDVNNAGPSDATGVTVTMNLDPTSVFNAAGSDAIAVHDGSPTGGVVTADLGAIASGSGTSFIVVVDTTVQGTLTADATVTGNETDTNPDNNTDTEDTLYELSTDLAIAMTDDPDPVIGIGGQITYAVDVSNSGPSDATGVVATIALDPTTTFVSADPPAVHAGGVVTADFGTMVGGSNAAFNIVVETTAVGRVVASGDLAGSGDETDPDPSNNTATAETLVLNDLTCVPKGIFSNIVDSPTSDVPDLPGAKFGTGCDRPFRSPDGLSWIISCDTDLPTSEDEVIIVKSAGSLAKTVVQEGVTVLDAGTIGDLVGLIDTNLSINDAGQFAFATNTNGSTSADEVIVKWDVVDGFTTVAREGDPALVGNYGSILRSPSIVADGTVWFDGDTTGDTASDQILFSNDGANIVLQEGVSIPTGQDGGATFAWDAFDSNDLYVDATGTNYVVLGDTENPDTTMDDILAYDNDVVVQEGVIVPGSGFPSPADATSPIDNSTVMSNGDWFARGGNDDDQDWVLRNGVVIAATGSPIYAGSTEHYSDAPFSVTFFAFAGNNNGDYIVAGTTDASDDAANAVLVLNNEMVVARENDMIDLDGNGVFDDNLRIRTFGNDDLFLTDDMKIYFTVTMRAGDDDGGNTDVGDAYLMVDLSCLLCGNGVLDDGEECDDGNNADGDCCSAFCTIEDAGTICRPSAGDCDSQEVCDGVTGACPEDVYATDICRPAAGPCDAPESCDGTSPDCPPDLFSTDMCRDVAGPCDVAEYCDGTSIDCPADVFATSAVECRPAAGPCDVADNCPGDGPDCTADAKSTAVCRGSTGACDPLEACDGVGDECPADIIITDCSGDVLDGCCPDGCDATIDADCTPVCGNGVVEEGEECDDGNNDETDSCTSACTSRQPVPTISTWGLLVLALLLLAAAKVYFGVRPARESA